MKKRNLAALSCAPAFLLFAAPSMAQQYSPGFEWNRSANWQPGTTPGSTAGNPQPDGEGNAAWQYEWAVGGPVGAPDEWFGQPSQLMVWDQDWYGIGSGGAWVKDDNVNPPIFNNRMTHNSHVSQYEAIPMVRWINPVGDGTLVDIVGNLNVAWSGHDLIGVPMDVEVVIALNDFSAGVTSILSDELVSKPNQLPSVGDSTNIPVSIGQVSLDQGDSIIVTLRAQRSVAGDGRWVVLEDSLSVTLIPAPGAAGVMGMAGLIALRRRRR